MLKIRIISLYAFLLLLVGVNMNVRASVDANELPKKSNDKGQQEKESQQHESQETISQLDFFSAFSLVNVQLQWRDLSIGLNDQESDAELSENQKELSLDEVNVLSTEHENQLVPTSLSVKTGDEVLPTSAYRTIDGTTHFKLLQNKQTASIIAFILNCSTDPLSC